MFDENYKKALAKRLGITDLSLLNPIVGENEFCTILPKLDIQNFSPGIRIDKNKIDAFDLSNVKNHKFCANLHVHTNASDGLADIEQILDSASKIADDNAANGCFGFLIGITDHDTVQSAQKVLPIITKTPDKYKNLKIVLGVEISTVATGFSNQLKTLDIHTLLYCVNPFEQSLNHFLENKMNLKLELANKTLNNLKEMLSPLLTELKLNLSLDEASKIHPMITKGQDEVSHPLKKYIFARTLYSYYVDNNPEIQKILIKENTDKNLLSYEKPVFKFKSLFNNEKYFYIYKDALEKYLNLITDNKYNIVLSQIPQHIEQYLLQAKAICEKSHPDKTRKIEAFSDFLDTLKFINTIEYGLASIAHPARINTNYVDADLFSFFDEFWYFYKKYGKDRAYAYEKYYQSYSGKKHYERLKAIESTAEKYNLKQTGGIDSHGFRIYSRA